MPSLFFHYATMNAGKSADLITSNHNYIERGMKTFVIKPAIDTREPDPVISSRIGSTTPCVLFSPEQDLVELISAQGNISCVFIDEAQFMTKEQVKQLTVVVDELHIPVMCYGLRSDFQGNLFPGSSALFALANKLFEIRTVCWCGSLANMVLRIDSEGNVVREGNQIVVGGNDQYVSVCRKHFTSGKTGVRIQL